ncbi:expressed unknown protein [Seminavis robusta]|uniref:Uncharacterized protein n=1 Tax=Seminavis robusta TaxID=568900 RepID=A0A9N8DZT6_9STRA|nr:expressed unknown protein [Seminavis robusta]|eukprot:Sro396_g134320.1 n/a (613) ;mRNA; f:44433-46271
MNLEVPEEPRASISTDTAAAAELEFGDWASFSIDDINLLNDSKLQLEQADNDDDGDKVVEEPVEPCWRDEQKSKLQSIISRQRDARKGVDCPSNTNTPLNKSKPEEQSAMKTSMNDNSNNKTEEQQRRRDNRRRGRMQDGSLGDSSATNTSRGRRTPSHSPTRAGMSGSDTASNGIRRTRSNRGLSASETSNNTTSFRRTRSSRGLSTEKDRRGGRRTPSTSPMPMDRSSSTRRLHRNHKVPVDMPPSRDSAGSNSSEASFTWKRCQTLEERPRRHPTADLRRAVTTERSPKRTRDLSPKSPKRSQSREDLVLTKRSTTSSRDDTLPRSPKRTHSKRDIMPKSVPKRTQSNKDDTLPKSPKRTQSMDLITPKSLPKRAQSKDDTMPPKSLPKRTQSKDDVALPKPATNKRLTSASSESKKSQSKDDVSLMPQPSTNKRSASASEDNSLDKEMNQGRRMALNPDAAEMVAADMKNNRRPAIVSRSTSASANEATKKSHRSGSTGSREEKASRTSKSSSSKKTNNKEEEDKDVLGYMPLLEEQGNDEDGDIPRRISSSKQRWSNARESLKTPPSLRSSTGPVEPAPNCKERRLQQLERKLKPTATNTQSMVVLL